MLMPLHINISEESVTPISFLFWQDEKAVGMWSTPASRLSSEPCHGPDVTLRLNNLNDSAASSSDSDVSSSKIAGSPSGGLEEAETCPLVTIVRRPNPNRNPEFYSVAEKTAMLGIAETASATAFPVHPAARLFPYSDTDRSRLHGSPEIHHDSSIPHASGTVTANENCFRVAADEHRGFLHSNRSSFGEGGHPLPLLGKTIPYFLF